MSEFKTAKKQAPWPADSSSVKQAQQPNSRKDPRRRIHSDYQTKVGTGQFAGEAGVLLVLQPSLVEEADQIFSFSSWRFLRDSLRVFGLASAKELDTAEVRLFTGKQPFMFSRRRWEAPLIEVLYGQL